MFNPRVVASAMLVCAASASADVLLVHASPYISDVQTKLTGQGLGQVDLFDGSGGTPSLGTLEAYDAVMFISDGGFADSNGIGDVAADYVDGGGRVVVATFAFWNDIGLGVEGRFESEGYSPFTFGEQTQGTEETLGTIYDPNSLLLVDVDSFSGGSSSYRNTVAMSATGEAVADWSDGTPLLGYTRGLASGTVVGMNFYPPSSDIREDFWRSDTDGVQIMLNSLNFRIPTPGAAALLGLGGLGLLRRRR